MRAMYNMYGGYVISYNKFKCANAFQMSPWVFGPFLFNTHDKTVYIMI